MEKQLTLSIFSSQAEYISLTSATYELQWLVFLLNDLEIKCHKLHVLYCDNLSTIHIATIINFHERTKYLEINCHIVREKRLVFSNFFLFRLKIN